jgi:hypothetical protein
VNTFEPSSQAASAETLASARPFRTLTEPKSDRIPAHRRRRIVREEMFVADRVLQE